MVVANGNAVSTSALEDPNSALMPTVICLKTPPSAETSLGVLRAFTRETSQAEVRKVSESRAMTIGALPSARTIAPIGRSDHNGDVVDGFCHRVAGSEIVLPEELRQHCHGRRFING